MILSYLIMSILPHAQSCLYQITHRADAGWDRVSTGRFLSADSYVPDIQNASKHYAHLLYNLVVKLDKEVTTLKQEAKPEKEV
jgi:hypothetical protein